MFYLASPPTQLPRSVWFTSDPAVSRLKLLRYPQVSSKRAERGWPPVLYQLLKQFGILSEIVGSKPATCQKLANQNGFPRLMGAPLALIQELDNSIAHSTDMRRAAMLRQLTDLYLIGADQYADEEIELIDDVFVRLVTTIEESSRALLSIRLGPVAKAPPKVIRMLACDDAIDVASPVLTQSEALDTETLVECAKIKSQEHMLAISRRKTLPEPVTDILVERGDQQVVLSTAINPGARFSFDGFGILVDRARGDDLLTRRVGTRPDLPQHLFQKLLDAASEKVRETLVAEREHAIKDIERIVAGVKSQIENKVVTQTQAYAAAQVLVESLNRNGQLNIAKLDDFARNDRFEEILAALAVMAKMPADLVERMVHDTHAESLLVLAKAVSVPWETTKAILTLAAKRYRRSTAGIEKAMASFERLKEPIARQILEFHRKRTVLGASRKPRPI